MKLKNYMEEIVDNYMPKVLRDMKVCECENCILDIKALALNMLPAKYVVTRHGESYVKLNLLAQQFETDVIIAITKGAKIVHKNPRH